MEATVLGLGLYLGRVTSANIISGLDPQELDRPRLSAKTACPKLDALANAASFAINSSIGGRLLAADGLGVRVCRAGGSAAHTALEVFSETYGLCAPFGRRRLPQKKIFGTNLGSLAYSWSVWITEQFSG